LTVVIDHQILSNIRADFFALFIHHEVSTDWYLASVLSMTQHAHFLGNVFVVVGVAHLLCSQNLASASVSIVSTVENFTNVQLVVSIVASQEKFVLLTSSHSVLLMIRDVREELICVHAQYEGQDYGNALHDISAFQILGDGV